MGCIVYKKGYMKSYFQVRSLLIIFRSTDIVLCIMFLQVSPFATIVVMLILDKTSIKQKQTRDISYFTSR